MRQVAIDRVCTALNTTAENGLLSLYRYRSADSPYSRPEDSDVNLLAVVADEVNLHQLKEAFLPVWKEHADTLQRAPRIASRGAVRRHLHLFPLLAHHLAWHGECVAGATLFEDEPDPPDPSERAAELAREALLASSALAPDLLPRELANQARERLVRLAGRLDGHSHSTATTSAELFALVQTGLREIMESLPGRDPAEGEEVVDWEDEPDIEALYNETDHTVAILPPLSERLLRQLEWEGLAQELAGEYRSLQVTTADQLRLILQTEAAIDFALGRFEHEWGSDPLDDLQVSTWAVWRSASRLPSRLLVDDLPAAYLTAEDEEAMHKVIHDNQNRLLNMRLQHELLHRLHGFAPAAPPEELPGREAPLPERIDAILGHLDWWASYYVEQMESTDPGEKLPAP